MQGKHRDALPVVVHPGSDDTGPEWLAECSIDRKGAAREAWAALLLAQCASRLLVLATPVAEARAYADRGRDRVRGASELRLRSDGPGRPSQDPRVHMGKRA